MPNIPPNHPDTPRDAYDVVQHRRETILEAFENDNEFIKELTQNYDRDVKRDLDTPAQVIPELLQNADDVEQCRTVEVEISDSELILRNDGRPLREAEFKALTHIGQSTKQEPGYIGHFGRGFKSVFSVTDNPQIRSGYFRFQFHRERCILPEHLETEPAFDEVQYGPGTEVRLPLIELSDHERSQLEHHVESLHRLMPYLRHVTEVTVIDHGEQTTYRKEQTDDGDLTKVKIYKDDEVHERRHIFSTRKVPPEKEFDELVEHRDLTNVDKFRNEPIPISISFPVDAKGKPTDPDDSSRLFNYFPTQEELPIPFDIQADFLLDSDRERLHDTESPYNQWIFSHVSTVYEKALEYYLSQSPRSTAFLELIPTRKTLDAHLKTIQDDIIELLQNRDCIPGVDGEWHAPTDIIVADSDLRGLLDEAEASTLLDRNVSYPADSLTRTLLDNLVKIELLETFSVDDLVAAESGNEVYRQKTRAELLRLVSLFNDVWENTHQTKRQWDDSTREFRASVRSIPLIPLRDGTVVSKDENEQSPVIPSTENNDEYDIFMDRLRLVDVSPPVEYGDDDELAAEWDAIIDTCQAFYQDVLDLSVVDDSLIISDIIPDAFANINEESDETLDAFLQFITEKHSRRTAALKQGWLRLRVEPGNSDQSVYKKPSQLYLPDAYGLDYSLETILRADDTVQFVTREYLDSDGNTAQWRSFLTDAGVHDTLPVNETPPNKREHKYRDRSDLQAALEEGGDTTTQIPEAPIKGGYTRATWLNEYRYALSDFTPSETFVDVLARIANGDQSELPVARAVAAMLTERWEFYSDCLTQTLYYANQRGQGNGYHADAKPTEVPSVFATVLRETSWCPTKAGTVQPPSTLLIESSQTIGQDTERYIDGNLPFTTEIYEALDVRGRLDAKAIQGILSQAPSVWSDTDPSTIRAAISTHLNQLQVGLDDVSKAECQRLLNALRSAPFIYVHSAEPQFRTPDQVVLGRVSLGDQIVSISNLYEQHHSFFQDRLGVRESVDIDDCLDFLVENGTDQLEGEQLKAWRHALSLLLETFESVPEDLSEREFSQHQAIERMKTEPVIPSCNESATRLADIEYYCHSEDLIETLSEESILSRTVQPPGSGNLPPRRLAPMWTALGLTDLETAVDLAIADEYSPSAASETTLVVDDARVKQLLTVCWSFVESEALSEEPLEQLRSMQKYSLEEHDELRGYYSLDETKVSETFPMSSYLDSQNDRILKTDSVESYYDIATKLVDSFDLPHLNHETLKTILSGAVGTEHDFLPAYLATHDIALHSLPVAIEERKNTATSNGQRAAGNGDIETPASSQSVSEESRSNDEPLEPHTSPNGPDRPQPETDIVERERGKSATRDTAVGADSGTPSRRNRSESKRKNGRRGEYTAKSREKTDTSPSGNTATHPRATSQNKNGDTSSPFESPEELSNTDIETALDNRPDPSSRPKQPVRRKKSGGGGGGGESSGKIGRYGEEFVLKEMVERLRRAVPAETTAVEWHWDPVYYDLDEVLPDSDVIDTETSLTLDKYTTVPGALISTPDISLRILHIRELPLGADILIEGATFEADPETMDFLGQPHFDPAASTWIEVKSSRNIMTSFELTPLEYGRAREQREDYHIVTLCNVGSPEM